MRLLRLALRNFRGVEEREVTFLPRGVTVVEGPNESGKTSLAEGLDLLLDKRASSTDRAVRSVQPVGKDVGSEVELEAEAGSYHFVYRKRFHRQPETHLEVLAPRPERLAGRAAHDRVRELLEETVDLDLWRALRLEQGSALEAPEVGRSRSLLSALEGEGASHAEGARDEDLFERVVGELEQYYSPKARRPTGELRAAREAAEEADARRREIDRECRLLEEDVERTEELMRRRDRLRAEVERAGERRREAEERHDEVSRLAEEVAERKRLLDDERAKGQLLRELAEAEAEARDMERRQSDARLALERAQIAAEPARRTLAEAEAAAQRAAAAVADERRRREVRQRRRELEERLAMVVTREEKIAALSAEVAAPADDALADLEALGREADRTEAALEAAGARLTFAARREVAFEAGAERLEVAAGETFERLVDRPLRLSLEEGDLELRPGRDPQTLGARLEELRSRLDEGLRQRGVDSLEAARQKDRRQREMRAALESLTASRLPGESAEGLRAVLAELPVDEDMAEEDHEGLGAADRRAREALDAARRGARQADAALERAQRLARDLEIEARAAAERRARARQRIGSLVEALSSPDEEEAGQMGLFHQALERSDLERAVEAAEQRRERAEERWRSLREELTAARPEEIRRQLEAARGAAEARGRELDQVTGELRELRGRLAARRQADLFERQAEATTRQRSAAAHLAAVERRAAAAELLHETFARARDTAREAYSEPLEQRIEELGRELFGDGFEVELDDELRIVRRILDGENLSVDQLSAGTREQLALIARLAAALVAAPSAGVPLIIDDALGFSDAQRLRAMGRVLELAGEHCQVILLTCFPERYRHVEGAHLIRFDEA